jgi:hypothetical protein
VSYLSPIGNKAERTEKGKEMTRKDYVLIAETLKELREELENNQDNGESNLTDIKSIALRFSEVLASTNPNFNSDRFLIAVGVADKCDKCAKRARFYTSRTRYCSLPHAPAWAKRLTANA